MHLQLPIYYTIEYKTKKDKTILVGLNWYRNAHHIMQNQVKQFYTELILFKLRDMKMLHIFQNNPFKLDYKLYYKNSGSDPSNIIALIEKFTLDALQKGKIITNDNMVFHRGSSWKVVEQDKKNPRCEIRIRPP
jgi:Holliday junction resolvase RusA-like endonuclease